MKNYIFATVVIFSAASSVQAQNSRCAGEVEYLNSVISSKSKIEQLYNERINGMKSQSFNVYMSGIANAPRGSTSFEAGSVGASAAQQHQEKINQLIAERNMKLIDYDNEIASIRRQSAHCFN